MNVIVGVYYRIPSWDYDTEKLFFEELKDPSKSTALVLMWDFNLPEITGSITQLVQARPEDS